jgi:hypothetical protein
MKMEKKEYRPTPSVPMTTKRISKRIPEIEYQRPIS